MHCRLSADCLNEIFEYLEEDKITLHSCLLVNRLWCNISVRILWRNIWNFKNSLGFKHQLKVESAIFSTLISCLPNESKEFLHKNVIFISTPTSKQPLFNYAAFCKVLSISEIFRIIINNTLSDKQHIALVAREIIKMFMNQISSLKKLIYIHNYSNVTYTDFPRAKDCFCLTDLLELECNSDLHSEFFYLLSQTCHNIQSLNILIGPVVSNKLKELISLQNNLKNLNLSAYNWNSWADIIPSLTKHHNTLVKLELHSDSNYLPLSFVSSFSNLQEINFFIEDVWITENDIVGFKELQYVSFPKLQTLKFLECCPKHEHMIKFLEINGKNLKKFYINNDLQLALTIGKFCPNLKKLFMKFYDYELDELKIIFNSCQHLESIKIKCGDAFLSEKGVLEVVASHSPKSFYELKIVNGSHSELLPGDLESFFVNWKSRIPKKSLNLIIIKNYRNWNLEENEDSMKIIEKYINLGVVKKFGIKMN